MVDAQDIAMSTAQSKKFVDALKKRDFAALGAMYTNDAVILPPGANIIMGRGNIQSYWEKMAAEMADVEFETVNVAALGTEAIREIGRFRMRAKPAPAALEDQGAPDAQQRAAKYVFVWQKVGGDWKVAASIWNRMGGPNRGRGGTRGQRPGGGPARQPGGRNFGGFGDD